jgi:hypothetical protein
MKGKPASKTTSKKDGGYAPMSKTKIRNSGHSGKGSDSGLPKGH